MAFIENSGQACAQFKHAIAVNSGNFYQLTELQMREDTPHRAALMLVPDKGVYDMGQGFCPTSVRYSAAPTERTRYANIENQGTMTTNMKGANCAGQDSEIETTALVNGQCSLPKGRSVQFGFDTFGREMKGLAWETDPMCAFSLYSAGRDHVTAWFKMLYREFPKLGIDDYERELQMAIIEHGQSNLAVQDPTLGSFNITANGFAQDATSMAMLPHFQRHQRYLKGKGFPRGEKIVYCVSVELYERMEYEHKKRNKSGATDASHIINYEPRGKFDEHLKGGEYKELGGVTFKLSDTPLKCVRNPATGELHIIEMYVTRAGTGGGVVWEYNPAYDEAEYVCPEFGTDPLRVQELILFASQQALSRQKMGKFQLPGQNKILGSNFELKVVDGSYIDCNINNEKMALYLQHRWVLEANNPEWCGGILSLWSPECLYGVDPLCNITPAVDNLEPDVFGLAGGSNPFNTECYADMSNDTCVDDVVLDPMPEATSCDDDTLGGTTGVVIP